jgi:molybdopterin molybdotransferase
MISYVVPENKLIGVDEALRKVLAGVAPLDAEEVGLKDALDRVLVEPVLAREDIPPFANSAMDGYAVRADDVAQASKDSPVKLRVTGSVAAGYAPDVVVTPGTAVRIMTGAPIPAGADTVVRFENTDEAASKGGASREFVQVYVPPKKVENVREAGEDVKAGGEILKAGTLLRPQEVGLLASVGVTSVRVHRRPRVAILSTGDELVPPDSDLDPGRIRDANEYSLYALVTKYGGIPIPLGIARDTEEDIRSKLKQGIEAKADLFLTSAGVSKGDYDVVKAVLNAEGEISFWMVKMKPGQPLAFGYVQGVPLLGLPGNPVSSIVSFEQFGRPMLLKMQGHKCLRKPTIRAITAERFKNSGRRNYVRVIVERKGGCYVARKAGPQGSGILQTISNANGLMIIPEGVTRVEAGESVEVQMLDWPEIVQCGINGELLPNEP